MTDDQDTKRFRYVEPEWDWNNQALRAQLRVGTVLETYDYGYIRVLDVTPEGVVSLGGSVPRFLWTWDELIRLKCRIHVQPQDPTGTDTLRWNVARAVNSGGVLDLSKGCPDNDASVRQVEQALGSELTRIAAPSLTKVDLHARVVTDATADRAPALLSVSISSDVGDVLEAGEETQALIVRLRDLMLASQGSTWNELSFAVRRVGERWRYNVDYAYEQ